MSLNKQTLKLLMTTEEDFLEWCRKNKKSSYKKESKKQYIAELEKENPLKRRKRVENESL